MEWASTHARRSEAGQSSTRCLNCGAFVTQRFARVLGDNENDVYGCLDCMTARQLKHGTAATPDAPEQTLD